MAKENNQPAWVLFIISALLLIGGWFFSSFPILIFFGFAPLFALTDRADHTSGIWEKVEWILFALVVSFFAASAFDVSRIVSSMVYAILFTLPFVGHVWVRHVLGRRAGKITIILLWLTLEYLFLKLYPTRSIYLADALLQKTGWTSWNRDTGYLGASLWVLMVNLLVYHTVFSKTALTWYWIVLAIVALVAPIIYAYTQPQDLTRADMLNLYTSTNPSGNVTYLARGEFVVRTAAWISTLIVLFTIVKDRTARK